MFDVFHFEPDVIPLRIGDIGHPKKKIGTEVNSILPIPVPDRARTRKTQSCCQRGRLPLGSKHDLDIEPCNSLIIKGFCDREVRHVSNKRSVRALIHPLRCWEWR